MRVMTATEVARNLSAVFDEVEHGERIIVTRGGRRIAEISPTPVANGAAFREFVDRWRRGVDPGFGDDVLSVREESRRNSELDSDPWVK